MSSRTDRSLWGDIRLLSFEIDIKSSEAFKGNVTFGIINHKQFGGSDEKGRISTLCYMQ